MSTRCESVEVLLRRRDRLLDRPAPVTGGLPVPLEDLRRPTLDTGLEASVRKR
ncbi:hypothetical protein ACIPSE_13145 [Streptomyces sp. NPDC090106]|uniref:hypothetical protein n=1 Tax=Streptomyces sp. NPDC090106 TaxID=3365946 RepID=UPI00382BC3AC